MLKLFIKLSKYYLYCLLLLGTVTYAEPDDNNAPIKIWADTFVVDKKNNLAKYSGNVKFEQGSIKINSEKLHITYKQDKIDQIIMQSNNGASFEQIDDNNQIIKASAKNIQYNQAKNIITFSGDATLQQGNNVFKAASMIFDTNTNRLITNQNNNGDDKDRVFISIQPTKK